MRFCRPLAWLCSCASSRSESRVCRRSLRALVSTWALLQMPMAKMMTMTVLSAAIDRIRQRIGRPRSTRHEPMVFRPFAARWLNKASGCKRVLNSSLHRLDALDQRPQFSVGAGLLDQEPGRILERFAVNIVDDDPGFDRLPARALFE